ncbi:glutathione S-transferase [Pseudomonas sp. NFACC02]|uniref:glutathione S-transferase family protein n=1 Tax=Pseudomonas sp. NFACC02 TaxID=1566250 RepID=UPI0008D58A02|nr:glutathione S-transferase family protein [Pseudomonas sp. NFACC02]SER68839.1 glutathione S-transferase [Pseudomonas sp. NFACC02]
MNDDKITLFHAPQSRSAGVRILLEELGAPHELHVINMKAGEQRSAPYLAINPLGKLPAIRHRGMLVTEQVAIYIYLADLFPEAGMAPRLDNPLRGPYLRWLALYGACYEPALVDRALKREPGPAAISPYGSFDVVLDTVLGELGDKPYLLGETISAADILWGTSLRWSSAFGLLPERLVISDYIARISGRPAVLKVTQEDAALAEEHAKLAQ